MNSCDHGHETPHETRVLPIGGSSNVIICHRHYLTEAAFRRDGARRYDPKDWTMPSWESLTVYAGRLTPETKGGAG